MLAENNQTAPPGVCQSKPSRLCDCDCGVHVRTVTELWWFLLVSAAADQRLNKRLRSCFQGGLFSINYQCDSTLLLLLPENLLAPVHLSLLLFLTWIAMHSFSNGPVLSTQLENFSWLLEIRLCYSDTRFPVTAMPYRFLSCVRGYVAPAHRLLHVLETFVMI